MKKYHLFFISALLFILANNWHFISDLSIFAKTFDWVGYGFFVAGVLKVFKSLE